MKICDLTQFYSPVSGGVKRYLAEKVAYLHEHTDDEHVLIVPGAQDELITDRRSKTYFLKSPLISKTSRYRALLRLEAVEEILVRERPSVIESGDPYQMAWKAITSGSALGIPVVGFYHSHFPEAYLRSAAKFFGPTFTEFAMDIARRYVRHLYNHFARTLVPSPALRQVLADWGVENAVNIDLGVNTAIFQPVPDDARATRARLGIAADRTVLIYVGRLAHEKNTLTLFHAYEQLDQLDENRFHLLVIGDGNQRPEFEQLRAKISNPDSKITWLPYCGDSQELARLYRAADLFVHPGVQETFGLVALESQACGTPVIGIRGSYMDRIIHNDQAFWAGDNSAAALAQAIADTASLDLPTLGAQASRLVHERYSWTGVFERLFAIYQSLLPQ